MPRCVSFRFRDSLTWASPDLSLRAVRVQALPSAPSGGDCPLFALLVLLTGLITQLTWDRLIGENQSILLARGGPRERAPCPTVNQAAEASMSRGAEGRGAMVWDFRGKTAVPTETRKLVFGKQV